MHNRTLWMVVAGIVSLTLPGCGGTSDYDRGALSFQEQIARANEESDPDFRARLLIRIARRQSLAKDLSGAGETLRLARRDCQRISTPESQAIAWALLAEAYAGLDDRQAARQAATTAVKVAAEIKSPESKVVATARAACARNTVGDSAAAVAMLESAEALASEIDDAQGKVLSWCEIFAAYQKIGRVKDRGRVLAMALKFAESIGDPKKRGLALAEIALRQGRLGDPTAAKTFDAAIASVLKIDDAYAKVYAMGDVAQKLARIGLFSKARWVLSRAEAAVPEISQSDLQAQALQRIRTLMNDVSEGP